MKLTRYGGIFGYNICPIRWNALDLFDLQKRLILIGRGMIVCPEQFKRNVL